MAEVVKKQRNSSVELLRLFALFSIVLCHTIGGGKGLEGVNMYYALFANTFFNAGTGVVILMLITGYFGAHLTAKRFNGSYSIIYVCSLFTLAFSCFFAAPSLKQIAFAFFPVTTKFLWYASCYIFTLLLSPFLDAVSERAEKRKFQLFILTAIVLFYVLPTFLYFEITEDKGKGIAHMIVAYFIGRYLKKYPPRLSKKSLWLILAGTLAFAFAGNAAATIIRHGVISYPFSRDCSVTTLIIAATLLLLASENTFFIRPVNHLSSKVFYIFLLEPHDIIKRFFDISDYSGKLIYIPLTLALTLTGICGCYLLSLILQYPALLIQKIMSLIEKAGCKIFKNSEIASKAKKLTEIL